MFLSSSALITILLTSNLTIAALWLFFRSHRRLMQISISTILIGVFLVLLRLLLPIEFGFERTIGESHILPCLFSIFFTPVFQFIAPGLYIYHFILFIWVMGFLCMGLRTIFCHIRFRYSINQESPLKNETVLNMIHKIDDFHGKSSNFIIVRTSKVSVPMYLGLFTPNILLPDINLSEEELYYILFHEATHYYKHDLWVKLLVELTCIIYWWNPFIYILKQDIDKIMEIRVDLAVTKNFDEIHKIRYLECLLKIAKGNSLPDLNSLSLTFDSRTASLLSQRFHIILEESMFKKPGIFNKALLVFLLSIFVLSSLFVLEPYSFNSSDQEYTVELTPQTAYLVLNDKKEYDVYVHNRYFATVTRIRDSYSNLRIYNNLEEALLYESKK
jgi:beta-lactamase regulating signal transducer with metallopeptidase domain